MKKLSKLILVITIITSMTFGYFWYNTKSELNAFHIYYESAEYLLDELFIRYDWVDALDPIYYYDAVELLYDEDILPLGEQ
jgi:uncharacterized protein YutE (UPF0331/DUF86 family)